MPTVTRPDGAVIHYEVVGNGHPLLLFAPGGVSSQIDFWQRSVINPLKAFTDICLVIGMDQRHAGRSPAPAAPFDYALAAGDQLAVLDALGIERAHVMGGCIGVAYALRLAHDAPHRVTAVVGQDPVGIDHTNSRGVFTQMFQPTIALARQSGVAAVVQAAKINPIFTLNNAAGPFAQRLHDDPAFRDQILALSADQYIRLIEDFSDGIWPDNPPLFTVGVDWLRTCPAPLLILPGSDPFHPTTIGELIGKEAPRGRCLGVDARSPENLPQTIAAIRAFLQEHAA